MTDLTSLLSDLEVEGADLDARVADLDPHDWSRPTPARGWTVAHQIGHLAWTDEVALLAVTAPDDFASTMAAAAPRAATLVDEEATARASQPPSDLLTTWRRGRHALADALAAAPDGARMPWFGPPMSLRSFVTARVMETWAHGQDVVDALGQGREPTDRLRHIAHLGVRTRGFAYAVRDLTPPAEEPRVELAAPSGDTWTWGPDEATERVQGPALDFCLLVTQRRHRDDVDLVATGAGADEWLGIAQAFAGPPGTGRQPLGGGAASEGAR